MNLLFDLVHVAGRSGRIEALFALPLVGILHNRRGYVATILIADEGCSIPSAGYAGKRLHIDSALSRSEYVYLAILVHNVLDLFHHHQGNRFDHIRPEGGINDNALCHQRVILGLFRLPSFRGTLGIDFGIVLGVLQLLLEKE